MLIATLPNKLNNGTALLNVAGKEITGQKVNTGATYVVVESMCIFLCESED